MSSNFVESHKRQRRRGRDHLPIFDFDHWPTGVHPSTPTVHNQSRV